MDNDNDLRFDEMTSAENIFEAKPQKNSLSPISLKKTKFIA
ncbi:hypothetical protein GCM10007063_33500 [Lentibacillus kapialis]|uniref:Uncharacterized protein n=1 Tax=Lentibacillus kapialis TaxID=340214 RepID=A0A917Q2V3_9BACI|nr:hypothetical protein [Lentibacillus kapialis]GGK08381.1 hypothetical protein GCM10007063_33500 [Lentibacillus kapialis]